MLATAQAASSRVAAVADDAAARDRRDSGVDIAGIGEPAAKRRGHEGRSNPEVRAALRLAKAGRLSRAVQDAFEVAGGDPESAGETAEAKDGGSPDTAGEAIRAASDDQNEHSEPAEAAETAAEPADGGQDPSAAGSAAEASAAASGTAASDHPAARGDRELSKLYYRLQWADQDVPAPTNGDADDWSPPLSPVRRGSLVAASDPRQQDDRQAETREAERIGETQQAAGQGMPWTAPDRPVPPPPLYQAPIDRPMMWRDGPRMVQGPLFAPGLPQAVQSAFSAVPAPDRTLQAAEEGRNPLSGPAFPASGALDAESVPAPAPLRMQPLPALPTFGRAAAAARPRPPPIPFLNQPVPDVQPQTLSPEMQAILLPPPDPRDRIFRVTERRVSNHLGNAPPLPPSRVVFPSPTLWRDLKGDYGYSRL
ncbi:hypothetical protein DFJ74DRAFT_678512 [Hyaloraphidium curvatum]|nr:hypothetical protein DFJ74DRAFT_678512 [Hyaloraphidium curvatum]